jgi:hypothetical protein
MLRVELPGIQLQGVPQMMAQFSLLVLFACLVTSGCSSTRARVAVHRGEVKAIENCQVRVENVFQNDKTRFASLEVACGVIAGPNWWGTGTQPLAFTLSLGDCTLLKSRFYCATSLDVDEAVTLEATYRFDGRDILVREL